MQFKAHCQRQPKDSLVAEHIGTDEVYIKCENYKEFGCQYAVVLSKEDALALASTIINHYKVEQK